MSEKKMDMAKVLAILAQPRETPPPLQQVERLRLELPYITKNGTVEVRAVRVVYAAIAAKPMPLIYVPHYEMGEDSLELRDYLAQGWAVACPDAFNDSYNGTLLNDDMVFNNAALFALRQRPEFDANRVALVGGSAGGYMTMMLAGQQLGLCACIANGPITNAYFLTQHYFPQADALNLAALAKLQAQAQANAVAGAPEKSMVEKLQALSALPLPFLAMLTGIFKQKEISKDEQNDVAYWEAVSAVGLADRYTCPIMVNHCTSDVLVPVDQITRRFTYDTPGDSLPADFSLRLPQSFAGKLNRSLEECLPPEATRVARIVVPQHAEEETALPFDADKQFNLNIYDDGPAEGYGTHSARMDVGRRLDVPYLSAMFQKTATQTCVLNPAMLQSMLLRYLGKDAALPAHEGSDDTAYGSLAMYRQQIREELKQYAANGGNVQAVADTLFAHNDDPALRAAWDACRP